MKLTRKEVEGISTNRILDSYRVRMTRIMIIYAFVLMAVSLPLSFWTSIAIWIFFLGVTFILMVYTIFYIYKIKPKARKLASKLYDQMLVDEQMIPESGEMDMPEDLNLDSELK